MPENATPPPHTNRLIEATSPYLLQHAHNPVNWREWGTGALREAREAHKPIFLSVGYSTCHWCHVMAHESFEDEAVAEMLNDHFVPIKVDREQRPDLDEQYMLATQLFTRRGGWPNSVWLTPDARPWYAGTYFPRQHLIPLLGKLVEFWRDQPEQVEEQARRFTEAMERIASGRRFTSDQPLTSAVIDRTLSAYEHAWDDRHGGFHGAPKFPPHGALALLLHDPRSRRDPQRRRMIVRTLDGMRRGGMYDQIGGGFHRYSTDGRWLLPHFEKMLYDNAQLLRAYADASALTGEEDYRRTVAETYGWVRRDMTHEGGAFLTAINADSEGEEGRFYVWTRGQILEALGEADGARFADLHGVTEEGNFRDEATGRRTGANVLHRPEPIPAAAERLGVGEAELRDRLSAMNARLLETRGRRVAPSIDDKVLSGWNGMMIAALAHAGRLLDEPRYVEAAARAARFVLERMRDEEGGLLRVWRADRAHQPAYLEDYALLSEGLLELHRATGETPWLDEARTLADRMIAEFHDPRDGGFYSTGERHEGLLVRSKGLTGGGNMPDPNGVAARVLLRLARLGGAADTPRPAPPAPHGEAGNQQSKTENSHYARLAVGTLRAFAGPMNAQPQGAEQLLLALADFHQAKEAGELPGVDGPASPPSSQPPSQRPAPEADAAAAEPPLTIEAYAAHDTVRPGGRLPLAVRIHVAPPYHIYGHEADDPSLTPTTLTLEDTPAATLGEVHYPAPERIRDPALEKPIPMHRGTIDLLAQARIAGDAAGSHALTLQLRVQACDERSCLLPKRYSLKIPVRISPDASSTPKHVDIFRELASP